MLLRRGHSAVTQCNVGSGSGSGASIGILLVQFAMAKVEEGMGLIEATLEGAKLRFRPIVMTSLGFGFGVLPLPFPFSGPDLHSWQVRRSTGET